MKIAITGSTGMVGKLLVKDYGVYPLVADITDEDAVNAELDEVQPHVVIHLAGKSNVDYCEDPANQNEVMNVNFRGALNVIRGCNDRSILCAYISTEQVFSGRSFLGFGGGPYSESSIPDRHVANTYGLTKLTVEGLRYSFPQMKVIRTSYLFTQQRLMKELEDHTDFPTFIKRSYIYLPHFVSNLHLYAVKMALMPPVLHLAGTETVSQYEFIREFVLYNRIRNVKVKPRRQDLSEEYAPRPHKCGLDVRLSASLGFPQYSYLDGLRQMEKDNA